VTAIVVATLLASTSCLSIADRQASRMIGSTMARLSDWLAGRRLSLNSDAQGMSDR
jgi:hypothetical protein